MAIIPIAILSLALAFGAGAVVAQDFNKGMATYNTHDCATALRELRVLAEQGHANAQGNLGKMYYAGYGVS